MIQKKPGNVADLMLEKVTEALLMMDLRVGQQRDDVELPPRDDTLWSFWRDFARQAVVTYTSALEGIPHLYLSTSCRHGEHSYCQSNTGSQGDKIPAVCKFCRSGCICPCHEGHAVLDPAAMTPLETGGEPPVELLTTGTDHDMCNAEPPQRADDDASSWGDCWCTKPEGHEGDHACEPCTARHGAPTWPQEPGDCLHTQQEAAS